MGLRQFQTWKFEYLFVAPEQWQREQETHFVLKQYELLDVWDASSALRQIAQRDSAFVMSLARAVGAAAVRGGLEPTLQELIRGLGRLSLRGDGPPNFALFYVARRKRGRTVQELPDPWKEVREAIEAAEQAPRGFVVVEAMADDEAPLPVPGLRVEFLLADGEVRTATTDGAGLARMDPIPQGQCHIILPSLDGSSWRPAQGASTPVKGRQNERVQWHTVKRGESLSRIAHQFGVKNWKKLWDHPKNEALRKKRKDPNVLLVGDEVAIAGVVVHELVVPTDQVHRILITQREVTVRLRLQDLARAPWSGVDYDYSYEHGGRTIEKPGSAPTNGEGFLEESVPITVREVMVTLRKRRMRILLQVDALDPARDADTNQPVLSGVQMRLAALGYSPGPESRDWTDRPREALAAFQADELGSTSPTGEPDVETLDALEKTYGA